MVECKRELCFYSNKRNNKLLTLFLLQQIWWNHPFLFLREETVGTLGTTVWKTVPTKGECSSEISPSRRCSTSSLPGAIYIFHKNIKRFIKKNNHTYSYDKRDDFNFPIVNFPFICSNIPAAPAYGVYISHLIRYSRACGFSQDFLDRGLLLTRKLLNQWFLLVKLKSSSFTVIKFYGRHHDMVDRYGISVSQMSTICSTCRKHFPVLSSFMTCHRISN